MDQTLIQRLERFRQVHLVAHWRKLNEQQRAKLVRQIADIDFDLIHHLVGTHREATDWTGIASAARSPLAIRLGDSHNRYTQSDATAAGREAVAAGTLGVVLVAGGQGSRLGFDHPKGMFSIGPLSHRTLLQMHIDQLRAVARHYNVSIPLYLMTSPTTHEPTIAFLQQHDRFGLSPEELHIFCQGTMPAVEVETGKLLMSAADELFLSPDGHGGTLAALDKNGCLQNMQQRGIAQLYYFQVDNPLVSICQSDLVGYHLLCGSELTTQVIAKKDPLDRLGNVVSVDGGMMVIEYSDLPEEHARRVDERGNLIFWAGSIAVHVFDVAFLRRAAASHDSLPFHLARKKVSFFDTSGVLIEPDVPNAIKFERFIFDLLPNAQNPLVVEAEESEVFAPLKNASGAEKDTPETTRAAIVAKSRRMLEAAGAKVRDGVVVEVNPLFALDAQQLQSKIASGQLVDEDCYFASS